MAKNSNLHKAKKEKNDEFYTQLTDIEKEMNHYRGFFRDKIVYCNCDDPRKSNFFKYFSMNFEFLGLKQLICTAYNKNGKGVVYAFNDDLNGNKVVDDEEIEVRELEGNGDFRSEECIEILKSADVVVTNPPFSLFREYVAQLVEYNKKFLIIGNGNTVTYKDFFPYLMNNELWLGVSKGIGGKFEFIVPQEYEGKFVREENGIKIAQINNACWFTNIEHNKRHESLDLYKSYNEKDYPKYDNYNAIDSKTAEIPLDYKGAIGVPITFLDKYCPEQFEIVGWSRHNDLNMDGGYWLGGKNDATINGKEIYRRILIKHKGL